MDIRTNADCIRQLAVLIEKAFIICPDGPPSCYALRRTGGIGRPACRSPAAIAFGDGSQAGAVPEAGGRWDQR